MRINNLTIGINQMTSEPGKYAENIGKARNMLADCALNKCQLACLPEAFATTIDFGSLPDIAEKIPGKTTDFLAAQAKEYHMDIIAGILEKDEDKVYSSMVYIDSEGVIQNVYRRISIYELEKKFLTPGENLVIIESKWGKIGLLGGYDINFPEICRRYFENKTELIVCGCQIPDVFRISTVSIAKARASENNCYFVLASNIGKNSLARIDFMGNSLVAQGGDTFDFSSNEYVPQKEVLAEAAGEEQILIVQVNLKKKRMELERNPHLMDRKPNYGSLEVKYGE